MQHALRIRPVRKFAFLGDLALKIRIVIDEERKNKGVPRQSIELRCGLVY